MPAMIPEEHRDLLERPILASFATINPDGQPQVTPVWVSHEGDQIWVNGAIGLRKDRNVRANPKVTALIVDPDSDYRWMEISGEVVEFDESDEAMVHVNRLAVIYTGDADYYSFNPDSKGKEQRVIYKKNPSNVNTM